jgi:hypothetical protein
LIGEIKDIEDELRMVDDVTAADVRRVATSVLRSPLQAAVIGPFSRESAFQTAIET